TAAVLAAKADLGMAFDGDGDRVMLVSEDGTVIDGDRMIGIAAEHMLEAGSLSPPAVVTTVMSNLGLERWLAARGIKMLRTPVGDRYVSHTMHEQGIRLGGETSGHVIFLEYSPTGDGILTAVKLLEIAHEKQARLGELAQAITLYPQRHRGIPCQEPKAVAADERVQRAIGEAEAALGERGRIVVRASGTQPLLRLMVESEDDAICAEVLESLSAAAQAAID
ncbi:phosphoglucosamine mutase, partial [Candidatus Bipolaricaulota bacterium]|nr:phosphoglucosamine mutase [Candidatus Bipolaricaulota bacterium]